MARIITLSRHFVLSAAFIIVMGGTGGLFGSICGVMLVLLTRAVLGMAGTMVLFMPAGAIVGSVASMLLGLFMVVRQTSQPRQVVVQPRVVTPAAPVSGMAESN